ncbi:hypothetical protein BSKO_01421 [Bryopsis sp. KO-2023]|nr:hypothetical protein BSKO_01421 [Bryopsis sp. KO-2023]
MEEGSDIACRMHLRSRTKKNEEKEKVLEGNARWGRSLKKILEEIKAVSSPRFPVGLRVWVKTLGYGEWAGIVWNAGLCLKKILPDVVQSYSPGSLLIRFYGDHSSMWCGESQLKEISDNYEERLYRLRQWGRQVNKNGLVESAVEELESSFPDCEDELRRMLQLQSDLLGGRAGSNITCDLCGEIGAELKCTFCERFIHSLCLDPPSLTLSDIPFDGKWTCLSCGENNQVGKLGPGREEERCERMGLTPDWIIHTGAFKVFQLEEPTVQQPFIKNLLDPCTNSKIAPNIPAEITYDKVDNGLKKSNSWSGHHIILNPDYKAQVQWRFVNRAIDEVENDRVPAVLLVCRNSTDTAYFQRLTPYPRVLLRRQNAQFKDYDKTPIGFGIIVFCIAKGDCHDLYKRFIKHFGPAGEPNVVVDKAWLSMPSFSAGFERLKHHADEFHRDHWIQCTLCQKWRIISYESMLAGKDRDWACKELRPPYTSCKTPQMKAELAGSRYAIIGDDQVEEKEETPEQAPEENLCFLEAVIPTPATTEAPPQETDIPRDREGATGDSTPNNSKQKRLGADGVDEERGDHKRRGISSCSKSCEFGGSLDTVQEKGRENGGGILETKLPPLPIRNGESSSPSMKEAVGQNGVDTSPLSRCSDDGLTKYQVLTGLELARQARIIANEACLRYISQGDQENTAGIQNALEEARKAALEQINLSAREQLRFAQDIYEEKKEKRHDQEMKMWSDLEVLRAEETQAKQALTEALRSLEDLKYELEKL